MPFSYNYMHYTKLYGTAQFKLDIYTRVIRQISRATCELHARKSLKYTFTLMSLLSSSTNLSGHSRVARDLNKFVLPLASCTRALNKFIEPFASCMRVHNLMHSSMKYATHEEYT